MELVFYEQSKTGESKELLLCDLFTKEKDGTLTYDWPFLPRKGEFISLRYGKENCEIAGIVCAVQWVSAGGFLNAANIFIDPMS